MNAKKILSLILIACMLSTLIPAVMVSAAAPVMTTLVNNTFDGLTGELTLNSSTAATSNTNFLRKHLSTYTAKYESDVLKLITGTAYDLRIRAADGPSSTGLKYPISQNVMVVDTRMSVSQINNLSNAFLTLQFANDANASPTTLNVGLANSAGVGFVYSNNINRIVTGSTIIANQYYNIKFVLDFANNKINYYVDGAALTLPDSNPRVLTTLWTNRGTSGFNLNYVNNSGAGRDFITFYTKNSAAGEMDVDSIKISATDSTVKTVTLDKSNLILASGQSSKLNIATVKDNSGTNVTAEYAVNWYSMDTNVATVDANGNVSAVGTGNTYVCAEVDGVAIARCSVGVGKAVDSVTLSSNALNLKSTTFDSATLTATVLPIDAIDKTISWTSSDSTVATVDANGKVQALKSGTATITATANSNPSKSDSCTVNVTKDYLNFTNTMDYTTLPITITPPIPYSNANENGVFVQNSTNPTGSAVLVNNESGASNSKAIKMAYDKNVSPAPSPGNNNSRVNQFLPEYKGDLVIVEQKVKLVGTRGVTGNFSANWSFVFTGSGATNTMSQGFSSVNSSGTRLGTSRDGYFYYYGGIPSNYVYTAVDAQGNPTNADLNNWYTIKTVIENNNVLNMYVKKDNDTNYTQIVTNKSMTINAGNKLSSITYYYSNPDVGYMLVDDIKVTSHDTSTAATSSATYKYNGEGVDATALKAGTLAVNATLDSSYSSQGGNANFFTALFDVNKSLIKVVVTPITIKNYNLNAITQNITFDANDITQGAYLKSFIWGADSLAPFSTALKFPQ